MKRIGFPPFFHSFPQFSYGFWILAQGAGSPMPGGGAGRVPSPLFAMAAVVPRQLNAGAAAVTGNGKQPHKLWKDPP